MVTLLTLFALIALAGGPVGAHFYLFSPYLGLEIAVCALALLAILFFVSLVQFLRNGPGATSWLAFLVGLASIGALAVIGFIGFMNPLHDVTTDVQKPPAFLHPAYPFRVEKGAEYLDPSLRLQRDFEPATAATQLQLYPNLETAVTKAAPAEVYAKVLQTIEMQLPFWRKVLDDPKANHAEWEVEDPYVHVIVDVAIDVRGDPQHPFDSRLVLRARDRIAAPDFGLNVYLLRDLKVRLNLAVASLEHDTEAKRAEFESGGGKAKAPDTPAVEAPAAPMPPPKGTPTVPPPKGTPTVPPPKGTPTVPPTKGTAPAKVPPNALKLPPPPPAATTGKQK